MNTLFFKITIILLLVSCSNKQITKKTNILSSNYTENLEYIANILNKDIPNYSYKMSLEEGFNFNKEKNKIIGLNIFDLNIGERISTNFKNGHIYHISPINFENSFSYILCVFDNKLTLFSSINCKDKGDSLDDVLNFIQNRASNSVSHQVIERIKDYRRYGNYIKIDAITSLKCDCEPCE
jgi:hypothetical protein